MKCKNPECQAELSPQHKFCPQCGTKVYLSEAAPKIQTLKDKMHGKNYLMEGHSISSIVEDFKTWLDQEGYEYEQLDEIHGHLWIQVKSIGKFKNLVGMGSSAHLLLSQTGEHLEVFIGNGKWIDKAVAGGAGLAIRAALALNPVTLIPLLAPTIYGGVQQYQLPKKLFSYFDIKLKPLS